MDTSRAQANDFDGSFLKVAEFDDESKILSDNDDDCLIRPREDPIEDSASSFVGHRNSTLAAFKLKQNKKLEQANTDSMIVKMSDLEMKVY
jgi:hypothetical protein